MRGNVVCASISLLAFGQRSSSAFSPQVQRRGSEIRSQHSPPQLSEVAVHMTATQAPTSSRMAYQATPEIEPDAELAKMRAEIEQLRAEALKRVDNLSDRAHHLAEQQTAASRDEDERPKSSQPPLDNKQHVVEAANEFRDQVVESLQQSKADVPNHKYTDAEVKQVWEHDPPHASSVSMAGAEVAEERATLEKKRRTRQSSSRPTLENTYWKIQLNIGRESGTWMPKTWGVSGDRLLLNLEIMFTDEQLYSRDDFLMGLGNARVCKVVHHELSIAPTLSEGSRKVALKDGGWRIAKGEGPMGTDLLRFFVEVDEEVRHSGGDVYVPPGKIYCSCGHFVMHRPTGIKEDLREKMDKMEGRAGEIQEELDQEGFLSLQRVKLSKELFDLKNTATDIRKAMHQAEVVEPDKSLLRVSRQGDVGLTREGGVCCKVRKGPVAEYHILGRFSLASVDAPRHESHE